MVVPTTMPKLPQCLLKCLLKIIFINGKDGKGRGCLIFFYCLEYKANIAIL